MERQTSSKYAQNEEGTSIVANLEGLDQLHTGFEVEVAYQPMPLLELMLLLELVIGPIQMM